MSMFENDYIKRLVKQVAELGARISGMKREGRIDEALEEMREAYGKILATDGEMLAMLDGVSAARMLKDAQTMKTYAQLLLQEADLHDQNGDAAKSESRRARALAVYRHAQNVAPKRDPEIDAAIAMLEQAYA